MINKIYILLLGIVLLPATLSAQQLYEEDGMIILNLTTTSGMPAGAITNLTKGTTEADLSTVEANTRVFNKLEIAPKDLDYKNWEDSFGACSSHKVDDRAGWRMPTQRELQLISIFKDGIEDITGIRANYACWSATKANDKNAFEVDISTGHTGIHTFSTAYRIRCVREIE